MASGSGVQDLGWGQYGHKVKMHYILEILLYTHACLRKDKMHSYDAHEALYLNFEIHGPWVRGSGPWVGPIWPYSENVLHIRKFSSILP